jgi:hypothetical protein
MRIENGEQRNEIRVLSGFVISALTAERSDKRIITALIYSVLNQGCTMVHPYRRWMCCWACLYI